MTEPESDSLHASRPHLAGRRVLVADSDGRISTQAQALLAPHGCIVTAAPDGREVFRLVDQLRNGEQYDIILTAISLPDMSGYDLWHKLKEKLDEVPMVLTVGFGYDPGPMLAKMRHAGLRAYLLKPFRRDLLLDTLERLIDSAGPETTEYK